MSRIFLSILFGVLLIAVSVQAQSDITRFQKQHNTKFNKKNLPRTQATLIDIIEVDRSEKAASALQTLRELELIFPDESFDIMLEPLIKIVKNENAEDATRILALFALENLHSDIGDTAIMELKNSTSNKTISEICAAMAVNDIMTEENETNVKEYK
jgi:hypothetical protein